MICKDARMDFQPTGFKNCKCPEGHEFDEKIGFCVGKAYFILYTKCNNTGYIDV